MDSVENVQTPPSPLPTTFSKFSSSEIEYFQISLYLYLWQWHSGRGVGSKHKNLRFNSSLSQFFYWQLFDSDMLLINLKIF